MRKTIGIVGLGKMGGGIARHLMEKGWEVYGFDRSAGTVAALEAEGLRPVSSLAELAARLPAPRLIWLMLPAGKVIDETLFAKDGLAPCLEKGDTVVDGGNCFYKETVARERKMARRGVRYIDVGFSGGPSGAREGGCLMVGGDEGAFRAHEDLFRDLARPGGYRFFPGVGAGHFVKMVHNGIEYGMMQAIGEGFAILKKSKYRIDLARAAEIYDAGSVIESRLTHWLLDAFRAEGNDLAGISGSVGHSGEGEWTAQTARALGVPAKIIEESYKFRVRSAKAPSFTGKVVSALRGRFGGHAVAKGKPQDRPAAR